MTVAEAPRRRGARKKRAPAARPGTRGRRRGVGGLVNFGAAAIVAFGVLFVCFAGAGPLPALGPAFNPVTGAWTMAATAQTSDETLRLSGLQQPVRVLFDSDGTAHITAQTDHDLFLATGYVHARFRLFQMDLMRRQGEGRLSEIVGKAALDSDRFQLELGLLRTAQQEWSELGPEDPARLAMVAYAQGVNDRIAEAKSQHQLDATFTLLGYQPKPWTPIDTLVIKGDLTQVLDFGDEPLRMALLQKALGADLASNWFPVLAPNGQSPYDLGPYAPATPPAAIATASEISDAEAVAAEDAHQRLAALPPGLVAQGGNSNNWAVAGTKSVSGGALLAGDPHLHLTLPAIWFQLTMDSPDYHASGVSIPGTPAVLIGHNQHIAWSLTNGENQATLYYEEKEDKAHPGQYFWHGAWQPYKTVGYDIPVAGGATQHLTVKLSVHGPVITQRGQTMSMWWAGSLPSQDISVLWRIGQAADYQAFRDALRDWHAPSQNFVYADDRGNIGMVSAGYYPLVAKGQPWLPMPGTGEYDVTGTIPFDQIPQTYDPPDGIVWSANQRQVTSEYPYYIGTAWDFYDPGYRANEIHRVLSQPGKLSAADMQALQTDTRDFLASEIVPVLLDTLSHSALNAADKRASNLLANWDYRMEANSAAATIWWEFWQRYIKETFTPWWSSKHVKVDMSEVTDTLGQDLEAWTLYDQRNPAFAFGGGAHTAADVMMVAFHQTVAQLSKQLGSNAGTWTWGRIHGRVLENLGEVSGLNYGPRPDRGDAFTPLAAGGFPSTHGPSWRMVVDWGTHTFLGVYPGGQSENPASSWYTNRVDTWWNGDLSPMLSAGQAAAGTGVKRWDMRP